MRYFPYIFFPAFLLAYTALGQTSPSQDQNYVRQITYQVPLTPAQVETLNLNNSPADNDKKIESIVYYDGLGRPKQQVAIRAGGNREDLVTPVMYDPLGRQPREYLPLPLAGNNGSFNSNATVNGQPGVTNGLKAYYGDKFPDDFPNLNIPGTVVNTYSEKRFEASPLNRVLEQAAPGYDWLLSQFYDTDHTIKFGYQTNTAGEVRRFYVTYPSSPEEPELHYDGTKNYPENTLYKNVTKDENWQPSDGTVGTTAEFKNKLGQTVLKRQRVYDPSRTMSQTYNVDTYYVYDDYGNLVFVLSPEGSDKIVSGNGLVQDWQNVLDGLCYQYRYDYRNRLVEKKIPGKGWEYIVYDTLDRPVLTQDANMRVQTPPEWLFTKYDQLGRVAYTGIWRVTGGSRESFQNTVNTISTPYELRTTSPTQIGGDSQIYYSNSNTYPGAPLEVLTVNYYDSYVDYAGLSLPTAVYGQKTTQDPTVTTTAQGLPTVSRVRVLGPSPAQWITSLTAYDGRGRAIYSDSHNDFLESRDILRSKLDLITGKPLETWSVHTKTGQPPVGIRDYFTYDHMGRLLSQKQRIGSAPLQLIAENEYDELGQLVHKNVGGETLAEGYTDIEDLQVTYDGTVTMDSQDWYWPAKLKTKGKIPPGYDGGIRADVLSDESYVRIGLVRNANANLSNDYFDYGIATSYNTSTNTNEVLAIVGGTVLQPGYGTYTAGATFSVERVGGQIRFSRNGVPFKTVTLSGSGDTFVGKVAMSGPGGSIENLSLFGTKLDKKLQHVDYAYNIRGWLTDINDIEGGGIGTSSDDLFNFRINYNTVEGNATNAPLYNGNIAQTLWKTKNSDTQLRGYAYSYDDLNRITRADSYRGTSLSSMAANTDYTLSDISFDKNGNILTLSRMGADDGTVPTFGQWDDLTYGYNTYGNTLKSVTDNAPAAQKDLGFKDGPQIGYDYRYDANGNMILDNNKQIASITYNHLNLPEVITFEPDPINSYTNTITYLYDAMGAKLEKKVRERIGFTLRTTVTQYDGNFVYSDMGNSGNMELQFFSTPVGYVKPVAGTQGSVEGFDTGGGGTTYSSYSYVFQYKDHLGNVRLSYSDSDLNGAINPATEIIEESNYYPFGGRQKGYNNVVSSYGNALAQAFKFGGKELSQELGLNTYDFGARNYDPWLGRWANIDPLADSYRSFTPYNYVANNPVLLIDPDGEQISFSYEYEKDKDGNIARDKDGNANLTSVTMTVTGKVMNTSGKDVDMDDAISEITGAIESSFNGEVDGISFNTVVNLSEAKSMDDVEESDHVFALANFSDKKAKRVFGEDKYGNAKGEASGITNQPGGRVAFIDVDYFRGPYDTTIGSTGERTGAHEFGSHMLNLGHTNGFFDLLRSGGFGSNVTKNQLRATINMGLKFDSRLINRGTNYDPRMYNLTKRKVLNKGAAGRLVN